MNALASTTLSVLFVLLGAVSAYYLVQGLRAGRFARRFPNGRLARHSEITAANDDLDYNIRDRDPFGFWLSAGIQVAAILACSVALSVLIAMR